MRIWENFLTETDKKVFENAGYDVKGGLGARPAILVIDVNYAFCGDKSEPILDSIKTWKNSCGQAAWNAIPHIQNLLGTGRKQHIPIFFSTGKDPRPDRFDRGAWNYKNSRSHEQVRLSDYRGNDILKEVAPLANEMIIEKLKPSVFHGTPLLGFLVDLKVDTLLVCGTTTSGCVRASVVDAFSYNFKISIIEECTFDRGEASHAINLFDMNAKYADVLGIDECLSYLNSIPKGLYHDKMSFK